MENEGRNMAFDDTSKIQMTIPERIVLSAGYDGDDNQEISQAFCDANSFDETPLVNPDLVMAGMPTPPSVLTIDHSVTNSFTSNSPNWHSEGDGAVEDENETSLHKYARLRGENDNPDDFSDSEVVRQSRSIEIAGRESNIAHNIPFDDPNAMQILFTNMQRRLTILENGLEYQSRVSNVWNCFLCTLTIVSPFIINYLFSTRKR